MFDKIISHKQLKQLKANLSDDEIETYKINKQLNEILDYNCKRLSKYFKHEIISHYTSTICHANDRNIRLKTPDKTFEDFIPIDSYLDYNFYDCGDRAEALIFGNKIKNLFVRGAMFILDNNNWNKYNNFIEFRDDFNIINKFYENDELYIEQIKKENNLIK